MKILLINPGSPPTAGRDLYSGDILASFALGRTDKKMFFGIPLAIPTLAAVTSRRHTVKIVDEEIESINFDEECDLVGITAMTYKATRAYEIAKEFKKRGISTIMGGIHASMRPDEASQHVDCVVIGEAEKLWPKIIEDFEHNRLQLRYTAERFPDISKIPPPRHDLTCYDRYFYFFLQTTRGCSYNCKFCTVTKFNGRTVRVKQPEQVIAEIKEVTKLSQRRVKTFIDREDGGKRKKFKTSSRIFFADDNFAINRNHAMALCRALQKFQDETGALLSWFTQVNYRVGLDDELLKAMKAAGCRQLFMGFESLNKKNLKDMHKNMNSPGHYAAAIENTQRHGIKVVFSTIIGNKYDTAKIGDEIVEFIEKNNVFYVLPNILTPYPGTALENEMAKDGRIIIADPSCYNVRNVVFKPRKMTPYQLQKVFADLCIRLFSFKNMIKRGKKILKYPQRYVLPLEQRLIFSFSLYFVTLLLLLKHKITINVSIKLFLTIPWLILWNGTVTLLY
jgi:radical SAM superfamily enzyme YgiQ (UPF0313 family)